MFIATALTEKTPAPQERNGLTRSDFAPAELDRSVSMNITSLPD